MASFDFANKSAYSFIQSSAVTANTNVAALDTQGYEGVAFVSSVATAGSLGGANTISLSFLEGDDTNISNASAIPSTRVVTNPALDAANTCFTASVVPFKRYLFATANVSGTVNANVHFLGALGYPASLPTQ
jgi:hypothetical protein